MIGRWWISVLKPGTRGPKKLAWKKDKISQNLWSLEFLMTILQKKVLTVTWGHRFKEVFVWIVCSLLFMLF